MNKVKKGKPVKVLKGKPKRMKEIKVQYNNVICYATNTPTSLMLPQSGCIVCDTSNYNYTLTIP